MGISCKYCGGPKVVMNGLTKSGTQRYLCKACRRTFVRQRPRPGWGRPYPPEAIGAAIGLFFDGVPTFRISEAIYEGLSLQLRDSPHRTTIYRWVKRYVEQAKRELEELEIRVGTTWVANRTSRKLGIGRAPSIGFTFWDCMDIRTKFLLSYSTQQASSSTEQKAQTLISEAIEVGGISPKVIITDNMLDSLNLAPACADMQLKQIDSLDTQSRIEALSALEMLQNASRVRGAILDRASTGQGILLDGWKTNHNFFRAQDSLAGC